MIDSHHLSEMNGVKDVKMINGSFMARNILNINPNQKQNPHVKGYQVGTSMMQGWWVGCSAENSKLESIIIRLKLDYMENNNFQRLLDALEQGARFLIAIREANQRYLIKSYKIGEFNPIIVSQLYDTLQQKFYLRRTKPNQESWFQNELRIFVWLLVGYAHIHEKEIQNLGPADWQYFVPIFNHRSPTFFEYQSLSLLRHPHKSPKWSPQEAVMLEQIIHSKNHQNKWNSIGRQLYLRSNRRFYRNPKQCREHWINHLDPLKVRSSWTHAEDLTLMTTISAHGKKWSLVVKKLLHTRTEHMVKNRYKSLMANQLKKQPKLKPNEIQVLLIQKLERIGEEPQMLEDSGQNSGIKVHAGWDQVKQESAKSPKACQRKGSNSSRSPSELIEMPEMIELSQSDFLNSPLPIPWMMEGEDSVL